MSVNTIADIEHLRTMVAEVLDVAPQAVTEEADFAADLGVDSLIALELVVNLERRYLITIDEGETLEIRCLRDVVELVAHKLRDRR